MIIDTHVHIFPDFMAPRAICNLESYSGLKAETDGMVADTIAKMDAWGVDKAIVLAVATKAEQQDWLNAYALTLDAEERLIGFGTIYPAAEDWEEQLQDIADYGLKGIKLHPRYADVYADDPRIAAICRRAAELGLVIVFHAGTEPGLPGPWHVTPQRLAALLDQLADVENLKLVAAHMGSCEMWDEVEEFLVGRNICFDTGFCVGRIPEEQLLRIIKNHGADKILFATDCPWGNAGEYAAYIRSLPRADEEKELIFHGNIERLLGL
ncbi:MAG: amidohydrolase family protein [Firmicutes bacterium]|nr:amidohydrolase family protein [Bacillota bacterium]